MRLIDGGGGRDIPPVDENVTVDDIFAKAKDLFFPTGRSPLGNIRDFSAKLGNYEREPLDEFRDLEGNVCSLREYLYVRGLYPSKAPFYLMIVPISPSTSDECETLPRNRQSSKRKITQEQVETKLLAKGSENPEANPVFKPAFKPANMSKKQNIQVKYQKVKVSDEEISSTLSCWSRQNCIEFAEFDNPEVKDIKLEDFSPYDFEFTTAKIVIENKELFNISERSTSSSLLLMGPDTIWGYDGSELLLGSVSGHQSSVSYSWVLDNAEIVKGEENIILAVNKPGEYRCIISDNEEVAISETMKIVSWQSDIPCVVDTVPVIESRNVSFTLANKIGSGGFGSVYKGIWEGTEVAIKEIPLPQRGRQQQMKSIQNEVAVHSKLRHPCIVQIMAISYTPLSVLLISEFIDGCNLENAIFGIEEADKLIMKARKKSIAKQICQAVAYMHAVNIIHQDIKPSNVLLERVTGNAKICDLGIGKFKRRDATTTRHDVPGTVMYMAPESLLKKKSSTSSDIWSLGCCLLELFTEKDTWDLPEEGDPSDFLSKKMTEEVKPPRMMLIEPQLQQCFEMNPEKRPTASQLIERFSAD